MINEPESPATPSAVPTTDSLKNVDEPQAGSNFDFFDPNSPLAPYYLRASDVLATILLVAIFFLFNLTPLGHSDVWGHLKFGEWIVQNHRLPESELLSPYSDLDVPMQNFQWISQVAFYETFRIGAWLAGGGPLQQLEGGVDMLRSLHAFLETLKAFFLLLAFRRLTGSMPWAMAGVVLVFAASINPSSIQRPQAFAEPLFAALLWMLTSCGAGFPACHSAEPPKALSWKQIAIIAALMTLWTNVHGSFLIGLALIGLCWLGRIVDVIRERGVRAAFWDDSAQNLFLAGLVSTTALSLLNPHGIRAIPDVLEFAKSPNVLTMQEWKPLEFSAREGGHWWYLALLILVTLSQVVSPRMFSPTQLLLLPVFGVGPLLQERLMTWWVMIVPVVVLPAWAELCRPSPERAEQWTSLLSLRKTIIAGGIVLVGLVWSNAAQLVLGHAPVPIGSSVTPATLWPITDELLKGKEPSSKEMADALAKNRLAVAVRKGLQEYPDRAFRGVIFTPEAMGDYLVWSLPPKAPVMVYTHAQLFPVGYWRDYVSALGGHAGCEAILDRYRVNLVIAPIGDRRALFHRLKADPNWTIIFDQSDGVDKTSVPLFAALRKKPLEATP